MKVLGTAAVLAIIAAVGLLLLNVDKSEKNIKPNVAYTTTPDWTWAFNTPENYSTMAGAFPRDGNWACPVQHFEMKKNIVAGTLAYNYSKLEPWQCLNISAFSITTEQTLNFLQSTGVHDIALDYFNGPTFNTSTCGNASTQKIASWASTPSAGTAAILAALATGPALVRMKISNFMASYVPGTIITNCTSPLFWGTFNILGYDSATNYWKLAAGDSGWRASNVTGIGYVLNNTSCGASIDNATLYTLTY